MRIYIFSCGPKTAFVVNVDGLRSSRPIVRSQYAQIPLQYGHDTMIFTIFGTMAQRFLTYFLKVLKICDFSEKNDDGVVFEVYFIRQHQRGY